VNIGKYCTRQVITATPETGIVEAAMLMREHHVGSLVVIDSEKQDGKPVGIITDRDILVEVTAEEVPLDSVTIGDIMTRSPVVVSEEENFFDCMDIMRKRGIRRLPVTDSSNQLTGIVSTDDLLKVIYEEMGNLVSLIIREQLKERHQRHD